MTYTPGMILMPAATPTSIPRARGGSRKQSATTIAASSRLTWPSHNVRCTGSRASPRAASGSSVDQRRPSRRPQVSGDHQVAPE